VPVAVRGSRDVSHTGAAHFPIMIVVTAGRGCGL
jgi:hypothetical protein